MSLLDELLEGGRTGLSIGGEWRLASDGHVIAVRDPADGEVIAEVAGASVEDGLEAVQAAHDAAQQWRETPPRQRGEVLRAAFELMHRRSADFAELMVRENGKALGDALGEVAYAAEFFRWYSEEAVRSQGSVQIAPAGDKRILVIHQPVGVSVLITPWNFPAAMATRKIGPAIAAGCTMILKPASETPLTALAVAGLLEEAGLPPGVVNVIPSDRSSEVVSAMLHDPRVRKLSFTGSTEVGRQLLAEASDQVLNCSMELGGNAPFLVFADADLDTAVQAAMIAKMRNGGQACTAANRFYVEQQVMAEFTERFAKAMEAVKVGPGLEPGVELGPLINEAARIKVSELVGSAIGAGASPVTGGEPPDRPGYFYPPTVLSGVPAGAEILGVEIFGPVAPMVTFDTEEEAVELANRAAHGLVAYVCTGDLERGLRVSEALEAGMVGLNRGLVSDPAAPFGGVKQSGIGREGGHEGLLEFLETKYIATSW